MFRATPRHALSEEAIAARNQFANVVKSGGPKHHGYRFGGSHTKFEAPLPGSRCYDVASQLQIVAHNPPPPRGHQHRVGQRSDDGTRGARRVPIAQRDAPIRT